MKTFQTLILCFAGIGIVLLPYPILAQEQNDTVQKLMLCYHGNTLVLPEQAAEKLLGLGAEYGRCEREEDSADSNSGRSGQARKAVNAERNAKQLSQSNQGKNPTTGAEETAASDDSEAGQGKGQKKVTICHKGKVTITIAVPALSAHLAHGDSLGPCSGDDSHVQGTAPAGGTTSAQAENQSRGTDRSQSQGAGQRHGKDTNPGKSGQQKGKGKE